MDVNFSINYFQVNQHTVSAMQGKQPDYSLQSMFSEVNFKKYTAIFSGVFVFGILFGYVLFPTLFKTMIGKVRCC